MVAAGSRQCHIDASLNCRPIPATPKMALGLILLAELVAAIHQEIKVRRYETEPEVLNSKPRLNP